MVNTSHSIHSLVSTFGQNKSVIYLYYKFIAIGIVKIMGGEWLSLPHHNSDEYRSLIGEGVFTYDDEIIFDNVPYIADVTTQPIQRPTYAQMEYCNGHKKRHMVDFHMVHSWVMMEMIMKIMMNMII